MHIGKDQLIELLKQHQQQTLPPAEQEMLSAWLSSEANQADIEEAFSELLLIQEPDANYNASFIEPMLDKAVNIDKGGNSGKPPSANRVQFLRKTWLQYAAAVLFVIGTGAYLWFQSGRTLKLATAGKSSNILSVGNRATLTLDDGSMIMLDSAAIGTLASQGNSKILKLGADSIGYSSGKPDGKIFYNTISTPKGGQYQIALPDGSRVWLNAASSIRFPTSFTAGREVSVTGEVYLEIIQNSTSPFNVKINNEFAIEVLGTAFNVNAYPDEPGINTTLINGMVRITAKKQEYTLKPGQQLKVAPDGNTQLKDKANLDQIIAWKEGRFNFQDARIDEVMRQIARWYDLDVKYEKNIPNIEFGGKISRALPLKDMLRFLEGAGVHFRMEGIRELIVLP